MTIQLYEGCWGVTRDREKPFKLRKFGFPPAETEIRYVIEDGDGSGWREDGTAVNRHLGDIIAVFATEAGADAYLAGETTEARVRARAEKATESDALARMGVNGATWAAEFREMALRLGYSAMDEGWLIGWFANAIEAGRDHSAHALSTPKPVTWPHRASGPFTAESDWLTLISDAMTEANKAMVKFPQPNYVISKFAEEAGEVVKAAIHCAEGRETPQNLRGEIKQAIAMLYRLWNEGDQVHGLQPVAALLLAAADKVEGRE